MNFQFANGTSQQQRWVQDAVAQCSYPLQRISATVTVHWTDAFPSNLDTKHPTMVTVPGASGLFDIYIFPWADDPTNPNNQGLPDPAQDIYDFYKQSFVHELGHVVTYSTFDPAGADADPRIDAVCGLFWRSAVNSGTGRRYGQRADWDDPSLAWADEIREAVAEVFKAAFYKGRLIFGNRTAWRMDEAAWGALATQLFPTGQQGPWTAQANPQFEVIGLYPADVKTALGSPPEAGSTPLSWGQADMMWISGPPYDFLVESTLLGHTPGDVFSFIDTFSPAGFAAPFDWTSDFVVDVAGSVFCQHVDAAGHATSAAPTAFKVMVQPAYETLLASLTNQMQASQGRPPSGAEFDQLWNYIWTAIFWPGHDTHVVINILDVLGFTIGTLDLGEISVRGMTTLPVVPPAADGEPSTLSYRLQSAELGATNDTTLLIGFLSPTPGPLNATANRYPVFPYDFYRLNQPAFPAPYFSLSMATEAEVPAFPFPASSIGVSPGLRGAVALG